MTNKTLFELGTFLNAVASKCTGKLGFYVAKNIRKMNEELTAYNNSRNELIRKYGKQNGENIVIEPNSDSFYKFLEEMKTYDEIETEFETIKFSSSLLEESNLNAQEQMIMLDYFVEDQLYFLPIL